VKSETLRWQVAGGPGPESLAIRSQERERLLAALEQLPDEQAVVLELHRVDGLSHEQIACALGITAMASRKRLERALATLTRNLGALGERRARHLRVDAWRDSLLRRVNLKENP
jgi:RNA polymerase sigma-70 factor (ECF subfamily)